MYPSLFTDSLLGYHEVKDAYKVEPNLVPHVLALAGDQSDNGNHIGVHSVDVYSA